MFLIYNDLKKLCDFANELNGLDQSAVGCIIQSSPSGSGLNWTGPDSSAAGSRFSSEDGQCATMIRQHPCFRLSHVMDELTSITSVHVLSAILFVCSPVTVAYR